MTGELKRGAGILLPVSSLPSKYGIGTFGKEAYKYVDWLCAAGQSYWQVLPLGPTSYGDSPYQSPSAFAGNPYFIDLDILKSEKLLTAKELNDFDYGQSERYVDYEKQYKNRYAILRKAFKRWKNAPCEAFEKFEKREKWLSDYALFMAVKSYFGDKEWSEWDEDIRFRDNKALKRYKKELADDIYFHKFLQYKFYEQWDKLKKYANDRGIRIIGDMPIYVSYDSSDVWVNPELFRLDEELRQTEVAGCPPDDFCEDGQKWGNPLYNWEAHEKEKFAWFKSRMKALGRLYDIIRIDHFIGIVRYYCIPYDKSAKYGWYEKGPGLKLTNAIVETLGLGRIIAEDLGALTPEVINVLEQTGFPGMKVLQFAFGGDASNDHLPHNLRKNSVLYIGTHDNEPFRAYVDTRSKAELKHMMAYLGADTKEELDDTVIRVLCSSVADTAILRMQDILKLGADARINFPSTLGDNWKWRMVKNEYNARQAKELKNMMSLYGRI